MFRAIIRRAILSMTACGVCLVVPAVVVWSWDVSGEHSVRVATGCAGCGCVELGRKR